MAYKTSLDVAGLSDPFEFPSDEALKDLHPDDQVQSLAEWFFHNFEDPAENTPYESAEGGYQYIWGGPEDAREQLDDRFAGFIDEEIIERAVQRTERRGVDWVPSNVRIVEVPEEDEDELTLGEDGLTLGEGELTLGEEQPTSPEEAAANVAASLKAFEAAVDALDSPGIGHNNPPEAIADAALTPEDIADTRSTIEALKDEIAAPIASSANLQALSDKIKALAKKVGAWLAKKADAVLNVALGAAGQATYSWAVDKMFPPQHHFFEIATKLAQDIGHWVALLPPPF